MDLKLYMKIQDIKIYQMAKRLGISIGSMHNLFNGREPRLSLAMKIEEVTNGEVTCEDQLAYIQSKSEENEQDDDSN